jgi:hypothetical protein
MGDQVVVPPEAVITLERAKLQAKLDSDERDAEVTDAIETARAWAQNTLQRAVGVQTLEVTLKRWTGCARLLYAPTSVESVTADGEAVAPADYELDGKLLQYAGPGPVVVRYVTGYSQETLPGPVKSAMLLMIVDLIKNPQGQTTSQLYENPALLNLLWPYRDELGV